MTQKSIQSVKSIACTAPDYSFQLENPTKRRILEQALRLFAEKGFDGASTREISEAAEVNHALIKYHFGNKEALWKSAIDFLFARQEEIMAAAVLEIEGVSSPAEQMHIALRHYVRYCAEYPEHARIMMQESTSENSLMAWAVKEHLAKSPTIFDDIFANLFESGELPKMSLMSLRYIFTAACQNFFTLAAEVKLLYGMDAEHEAQIEAHIDAVTKLFLPNYKSSGKRIN